MRQKNEEKNNKKKNWKCLQYKHPVNKFLHIQNKFGNFFKKFFFYSLEIWSGKKILKNCWDIFNFVFRFCNQFKERKLS